MKSDFLSRREASQYLCDRGFTVPYTTLGWMAVVGGGPRFQRFGRYAVYRTVDLDAWAEARLQDREMNAPDGDVPKDRVSSKKEMRHA